MSRVKDVLRSITPPIIWATAGNARRRREGPGEWQYAGTTWPVPSTYRGWNSESVVDAQQARVPALRAAATGTGPMSEDLDVHNTLMCFGYVLGRAVTPDRQVSILDWGGGLGQYGIVAEALYPDVAVEYHCVDLPVFGAAPTMLVPPHRFHRSDEPLPESMFDLVFASGALHYVERWQATLASLAAAARRFVFITRLPIAPTGNSYVTVQRPYAYGYDTEYPGWVINRREFVDEAKGNGLDLRREFLIGESPVIPGEVEQPVYRGFLFERVAS